MMNINRGLYATLFISFLFLLAALSFSYKNISHNNDMIKYIEKEQIKLNFFANKLNYDIKKNQANVLQLILLEKGFTEQTTKKSFQEIQHSIDKLEKFLQKTKADLPGFLDVLNTIKKRVIAYKDVQSSLLKIMHSEDKHKFEETLFRFNHITQNFFEDTNKLIDISNENLYTKVLELKANNDLSAAMILFSFLTAIILITFVIFKFLRLHTKLEQQLQRAEAAEKEQKSLQKQLLHYNEDLEKEVAKKAQEIRQKIYTNFLTGLPNRNKLLEDLALYDFKMVALLNIDKFQSFNDIYGEEVGNIAIKLTAEFFQEELKDEELELYHVGGDEFAICAKIHNNMSIVDLENMISEIIQEYQHTEFQYEDKKFSFMISAGIAFSGRKKMLAYTDMALKDAKKRNIPISIFNDDKKLEKIHKEDIECHKKLVTALETDNLIPYFQPIVPIQNNSLPTKYESLARLIDETGKVIPPFNFIDVAKANRIYYKITNAMIHHTFNTIAKYKIPCSINISLKDIENQRTMKHFFDEINRFEYNKLLTIELLETEDFVNYQVVYDFCIKVRSFGLKVALDDFGSGYSNFSHILHLPIDYIKIDASLISNIDRDQNSRIMVETIVDLAHKLNVLTIAEFVSSQEILDVIKEVGVDYAQGYHMGKPELIEHYLT